MRPKDSGTRAVAKQVFWSCAVRDAGVLWESLVAPECPGQCGVLWQVSLGLEPMASAFLRVARCEPALWDLPSGCTGALSLAHHVSPASLPVELQESVNTWGLTAGTWHLHTGLTLKTGQEAGPSGSWMCPLSSIVKCTLTCCFWQWINPGVNDLEEGQAQGPVIHWHVDFLIIHFSLFHSHKASIGGG